MFKKVTVCTVMYISYAENGRSSVTVKTSSNENSDKNYSRASWNSRWAYFELLWTILNVLKLSSFNFTTGQHKESPQKAALRSAPSLSACLSVRSGLRLIDAVVQRGPKRAVFLPRNAIKRGIYYDNVCPSVRPSVCHTRESRLNG